MNRQQMADHLGVDRSAMSSELGKMKKDGIIDFDKNHFILL
jgi:Mn-dependent DtxR family transcriptional regulator